MRDGTFAMPEGWTITFMFLFVSLSGWFGFKVLLCSLGSVGLHSTSRPRSRRWKINSPWRHRGGVFG